MCRKEGVEVWGVGVHLSDFFSLEFEISVPILEGLVLAECLLFYILLVGWVLAVFYFCFLIQRISFDKTF